MDGGNIDAAESIFCDHVAVSKKTKTAYQPFFNILKHGLSTICTSLTLEVLSAHKHFKKFTNNSERYVE
jgi:hypothetical protein